LLEPAGFATALPQAPRFATAGLMPVARRAGAKRSGAWLERSREWPKTGRLVVFLVVGLLLREQLLQVAAPLGARITRGHEQRRTLKGLEDGIEIAGLRNRDGQDAEAIDILIVEFATQRQEAGVPRRDATPETCRLRLRPSLMTSFAFILGGVPLVLAEGTGAELRQSLGTAVFGGMLGVTLFGIFRTLVSCCDLQWFGETRKAISHRGETA
jgi:hypothetical protein